MLGETLLVAPVFTAEGDVDVYLPEGTWTSLLTGDRVTGPRWVRERHGYLSLPLYVRPDSVLPVGPVVVRPVRARADGHRSVTTVPGAAGGEPSVFVVRRDGAAVRVEARGATGPWRVQVGVGGTVVEAAARDGVVELTL